MDTPVTIHPYGICPECESAGLYLFIKEINCLQLSASGVPIGDDLTDFYRYLFCPSCKAKFEAVQMGQAFRPMSNIERFIRDYKLNNEH